MAIDSLALHATIAPPLFAGRAVPSPLFTGRAGTPQGADTAALSRLLPSGVLPETHQAVIAAPQDSQTVGYTPGGPEAGRARLRQTQHDSSGGRTGPAGSSPPTYDAQGALQNALRTIGATVNLAV